MNKKINFKSFIINESTDYFASKVGDILTGLQQVENNLDGIGLRELSKSSESIANQIRRILHTHWPREMTPMLEELQKIGVAILRTIRDKGDLREIIPQLTKKTQSIVSNQEKPINDLTL